jgi:hypothetical protein
MDPKWMKAIKEKWRHYLKKNMDFGPLPQKKKTIG